MGDGGGDGDGDDADAGSDGGDEMALNLVITVVMTLAETSVTDIVAIVLVTMMLKMKVDPSFFSGPLQNLSPPRRPCHSHASKTVPPAGLPGAPGVPGPHLHHPSIWPAAQGPQWEGNIPRALPSFIIKSRLGYKYTTEVGYNLCPGEFRVRGGTRQTCINRDMTALEFYQGPLL